VDDMNENGVAEMDAAAPASAAEASIKLELSLEEGDSLRQWLLKSTVDGASALDDPLVSASLKELSHSLDFIHTVVTVREELEAAGFDTDGLADEQVAELAKRIREANVPLPR
jgi:2-methylcitrate dehydratase PrpD